MVSLCARESELTYVRVCVCVQSQRCTCVGPASTAPEIQRGQPRQPPQRRADCNDALAVHFVLAAPHVPPRPSPGPPRVTVAKSTCSKGCFFCYCTACGQSCSVAASCNAGPCTASRRDKRRLWDILDDPDCLQGVQSRSKVSKIATSFILDTMLLFL